MTIGNFIGDFVKGNQYKEYPDKIAKGVLLHREIDRFTDTHKLVTPSKDRLRKKYRHYAGVIVDVFYDHFLAKNFHQYHPHDLGTFVQLNYKLLMRFYADLPVKAQHMLPYMIASNWLLNYAKIEGIKSALEGMSRRTRFDSKMNESIQELEMHYQDFEKEFRDFFPVLAAHISQFREDLINS